MSADVTIRKRTEHGDYELISDQWFPQPKEELFPFFGDATNLEKITPDMLQFKVLTPSPIEMKPGTLIDYKLKVHGIPIRWRTEIEIWEPPVRFVDNQIKGPYRLWHHTHTFEDKNGGTLMRDRVLYRPPLGALANRLIVQRDVQKIFENRYKVLEKLFGKP